MKVKETCENCPDFASCTELCEEKKSQLKELPTWSKEAPESQFPDQQSDDETNSDDDQGIDRFRKISPGNLFEDARPAEIDWEETPIQPRVVEIEESERHQLYELIRKVTRNDGFKLKRRLWAFLRCETMTSIAKRSGTSKQNIQKSFERRIDKVHRMLKKGEFSDNKYSTPLQFKLKVGAEDF